MSESLNPEHQERIKQKVDSGLYPSATEVLNKALELLDAYDSELAEVITRVQEGISQLENGQYTEYTDETLHYLIDRVKKQGRQRRARFPTSSTN